MSDDLIVDTSPVYEKARRLIDMEPDGGTSFPPAQATKDYFEWF